MQDASFSQLKTRTFRSFHFIFQLFSFPEEIWDNLFCCHLETVTSFFLTINLSVELLQVRGGGCSLRIIYI